MSGRSPRVSIGMPVYNGEPFLSEALGSILAQTFDDFEILISDNGSTDRTREICEAYAAQDHRVRYYRKEHNVGAAPNFNRVFSLSRGEYFKWAAHDDLIAPDFLAKCIDVLDHRPDVVLCYSLGRRIDALGHFIRNEDVLLKHIDHPDPRIRFADLILIYHGCSGVFGLIRSDVLKRTSLIGSYIASDRILLAELGLRGKFHVIPEYLFYAREHPKRSIRALPNRTRAVWFDKSNAGRILFPKWRRLLEYYKALKRAPLSWHQRMSCYMVLGKWLWLNKLGLLSNLVVAAGEWIGGWDPRDPKKLRRRNSRSAGGTTF